MNKLSGLRLAEGAGTESPEVVFESKAGAEGCRNDVLGAGGGMSEAGCVVAATEGSRVGGARCDTGLTDRSRAGVAGREPVGILPVVDLVIKVNSARSPLALYEICIGRLPRA